MKKNSKSRGKKYLLIFVTGLICLIWVGGVIRVNCKVPQVQTEVFENNQWVDWKEEVAIKVTDYSFMNDAEIRGNENVSEDDVFSYEMKLLWVELHLKNNGEHETTVDLLDFGAESDGWYNIPDVVFYEALGKSQQPLRYTLKPKEEVTYHLPYLLLKANFSKSEWKRTEEKEYFLTWKLYPQKKTIQFS